MVSRQLVPENMNSKLGTQTIDISVDGKCPETKSLRVVNGESRTDEYCINNVMGGCRWYIIPKDFTNEIVKYVENRLSASNIKVGSGSDIIVSLEELKSQVVLVLWVNLQNQDTNSRDKLHSNLRW